MTFSVRLRAAMQRHGLTQQQLAEASGISDSEVSRLLAGKSRPGLETASKLARVLGLSLDELAADETAPGPPPDPARSSWDEEILSLAREIGPRDAAQILANVRILGAALAQRRLLGVDRPAVRDDPAHPTGSSAD